MEKTLKEAALEFVNNLPKCSWTPTTTENNHQYGELHRIYYDVCDINQEDKVLVELLQPFVKRTIIQNSLYSVYADELREYLNKPKFKAVWTIGKIDLPNNYFLD